MRIEELKQKLYDSTFLLGSMRQKAAIKALAASEDTNSAVALAEALDKGHPRKERIKEILL